LSAISEVTVVAEPTVVKSDHKLSAFIVAVKVIQNDGSAMRSFEILQKSRSNHHED
jgi:hypothetical protein